MRDIFSAVLEEAVPFKQGAEAKVYKVDLFPAPEVYYPPGYDGPVPAATSADPILLKYRFKKSYRHPDLDASLLKSRLGSEARTLARAIKAGISVPAVRCVDQENGIIGLEWIDGPSLRALLASPDFNLLLQPNLKKLSLEGTHKEEDNDGLVSEELTALKKVQIGSLNLSYIMTLTGNQIASLHAAEIIHGDLTTSNVMMRLPTSQAPDPVVVIIDFGLSYNSSMQEDRAVDLYVLERAFHSTHPGCEELFNNVLVGYREAWQSGSLTMGSAKVIDDAAKVKGCAEWNAISNRLDEDYKLFLWHSTQIKSAVPMAAIEPASLLLSVRDTRFLVDREHLMTLPESVLLCLFPNGLVLSHVGNELYDPTKSDDENMHEEEEVYFVDFDPQCLSHILTFFNESRDAFYGTPTSTAPALYPVLARHNLTDPAVLTNPLLQKQAIIVLREELEFFPIPSKGSPAGATESGKPNAEMLLLKHRCAKELLTKEKIFQALQRSSNKENNSAEQHLIDMLCMSGFDSEDLWTHRALEPGRCVISSIALVRLKTGIALPQSSEDEDVTIDQAQMLTAQKLLLFWRKPARKCWWDGVELTLPEISSSPETVGGSVDTRPACSARVWARRVWTLELSLV